MNKKTQVVLFVAGLLLLLNVSCKFFFREPVRVGVFLRPGCEIVWIAKEKGYFEEEGLDVIISQYSSWISCLNAFNEGKTDISMQTLMSSLVSMRGGVVIAVTDKFKGDVLVGKRHMKSLLDMANLKGKAVSAEIGTDGFYFLNSVIQGLGLAQREINLLPQFTDEAVDSFVRGDIHAVFCYPPYLKKALKMGKGRVLFSQDFSGISPSSVIVASKNLIETRPDDAARFIRAWFKAVDYFKNHRDEAVKIMAEAEGVSPEEFSEFLSDLKIYDHEEAEGVMTSSRMEEAVNIIRDFLKKQGIPVGKINLGEFTDDRFIGRKK